MDFKHEPTKIGLKSSLLGAFGLRYAIGLMEQELARRFTLIEDKFKAEGAQLSYDKAATQVGFQVVCGLSGNGQSELTSGGIDGEFRSGRGLVGT